MKLPPGLSTPPLVQTLQLVINPIRFFERCARDYGDVFTARVLGLHSPPVVFLGHPDAVKAVFTAPPGQFELGKVTHVFRPLTGEQSLIMMEGEQHQRQRQLLMPPLHGERMALYGETICQLTQNLIQALPQNQVFSMRKLMAEITLDTILQVVFGVQRGERYEQLKIRIGGMLEAITNPIYSSFFFFPPLQQDWGAWSPWGHFTRLRHAIDTLVYQEIAERRTQDYTQRCDLLSLLMAAEDEQGKNMSDQELRDQLMTLLLLGHETTASSLAWAFYWIYHTPSVLAKLQQELAGAESNPAANLPQLPYLNAVCQETLRLYPIALIAQPRIVKEPLAWQDYFFEVETILVPCIYLAHHRPEQFPESHSFKPERFLKQKITAYEYFPFGGGSRACIGSAFSLFEMKLVLGTIISILSLKLVNPDKIKPVRRGITIVPASGVQMIAKSA